MLSTGFRRAFLRFQDRNLKATQTLSQPPNPGNPQFPSNLIKVKATQTLTPVRGVTDTRLFNQKFLVGGGGGERHIKGIRRP